MKKSYFVLSLIFLVLLLDQLLKVWVKLSMPLGDSFEFMGLSWFHIHFIENPGMAFGIEWGGAYGKLALSLFRIVAISFIGYMLYKLVKQNAPWVVLTSISLIFTGAVGNIVDSIFYGVIFSQSTAFQVADFMPDTGGYSSLLHGRVVDMFYFPLIDSTFPTWIPIWGGRPLQFFEFIFNIADASVFMGTAMIFLFYKYFFNNNKKEMEQEPTHLVVEELHENQSENKEIDTKIS